MDSVSKKIFLSYGHESAMIVEKIKSDLEKAGHSVWIDNSEIKRGSDWQESITKAILNCDIVLAFFSKHSLRAESVCLNELAIAVATKDGCIKTVVLDQGIEQNIPLYLSRIQFCDMSLWREKIKDSDFNSWYQEKFSEIQAMILSDDNFEKDRQLSYLKQVLCPELISSHCAIELKKNYVNRKHIVESIDSWVNNNESSPFYLIYGTPGTGKSAFSAHYGYLDYRVVAATFCEWGRTNHANTIEIICTIAFQMATKLHTYRQRLVYFLEQQSYNPQADSLHGLFEKIIIKPMLDDISLNGECAIIIIDGIDEANQNGKNVIAEVISDFRDRIPQNLRFILTSRNDSIIQRHFYGCPSMILNELGMRTVKDIQEFFVQNLNNLLKAYPVLEQTKILSQLTKLSDGSFLFAELLVKEVRQYNIPLHEIEQMPQDLNSCYYNWFNRLFPDEDEFFDEYYDLFSFLTIRDIPLPLSMLEKVLNCRKPILKRKIQRINQFLGSSKNVFWDNSIFIFQRSFKEWLCSEQADIFQVDPAEGLERLCDCMLDSYRNGSMSEFEIEYFPEFLVKTGRYDVLDEVLNDSAYLESLMNLGERYEKLGTEYSHAEYIYSKIHEIYLKNNLAKNDERLFVQLLYRLARCNFALGNYSDVKELLLSNSVLNSEYLESIPKLDCTLMLANIHDWFGNRKEAVGLFAVLIEQSVQLDAHYYLFRGYVGLIWNDHFSDVQAAFEKMVKLKNLVITPLEQFIIDLCLARMLLSSGSIAEALNIYKNCLNQYNFELTVDTYIYRKARMLMLEILPACFDNERYSEGIAVGELLFSTIKDKGNIEESYCASWIALNALKLGYLDLAKSYLAHAILLNENVEEFSTSNWIKMHLKSIESFLAWEIADYDKTLEINWEVHNLARECNDSWVDGDACFWILRADFFKTGSIDLSLPKLMEAYKTLNYLADATGLLHLRYKSNLIKALNACNNNEISIAKSILYDFINLRGENFDLPSTDPVESLYLEYYISNRCLDEKQSELIRNLINSIIEDILVKNNTKEFRSERYLKRECIRRILSEIGEK